MAGRVWGDPCLGSGSWKHLLRLHLHQALSGSGAMMQRQPVLAASYAVYLPCCVPPARACQSTMPPTSAYAGGRSTGFQSGSDTFNVDHGHDSKVTCASTLVSPCNSDDNLCKPLPQSYHSETPMVSL